MSVIVVFTHPDADKRAHATVGRYGTSLEHFGDRVVTLGAEIVRDQATQAASDNEREKSD